MIYTERLTIRTFNYEDLMEYYAKANDVEADNSFMPIKIKSYSEVIKNFEANGFWEKNLGTLIIENKSGELVGEIGCFTASHYMDGYELFYRVFPKYRNNGIASEAVIGFVKYYFNSNNLGRLQAVVASKNLVSEKVLKKVGFKYEGTFRKGRFLNGELIDLNVFSVLRSEQAYF